MRAGAGDDPEAGCHTGSFGVGCHLLGAVALERVGEPEREGDQVIGHPELLQGRVRRDNLSSTDRPAWDLAAFRSGVRRVTP